MSVAWVKRSARRGMGRVLRFGPFGARGASRGGTVVLMYHRVLPGGAPPDWPLKSLVVDVQEFERQMSWLVTRFHVCTAFEALCAPGEHGRPRAVVTFDDGYRDNFLHAAPVLKRHGISATFFVTTRFIGGTRRMWFDVAAAAWRRTQSGGATRPLARWMADLKRASSHERAVELSRWTRPEDWEADDRDMAMSWSEVQELQSCGHEIGCHSRTHPILTMTPELELRDEVAGAVEDLRHHGLDCKGIAYPNGDYNDATIAMTRACGLRYGVSTRAGWHVRGADVYAVKRVDVNPALVRRWSDDPATGLATELGWRCFGGSQA